MPLMRHRPGGREENAHATNHESTRFSGMSVALGLREDRISLQKRSAASRGRSRPSPPGTTPHSPIVDPSL